MSESDLAPQPISKIVNASMTGSAADIHRGSGTVWNGGNATSGEGWSKTLLRELANRYFASSLWSWWATGPDLLPKLSDDELNVTKSVNNTGNVISNEGYFSSWANCVTGSLWEAKSNLRRTILGTSLHMMRQWTGVNFIFYYSTPFLKSTNAISNTFLTSLVFTLINVLSTLVSFWAIEKFGRRPLLIWGAFGMLVCQFIVAIVGDTVVPTQLMAVQSPIMSVPSMPRPPSSASTFSSSLPRGDLVHGSLLVKSSLYPSDPAVSPFPLHPIGFGIPLSPYMVGEGRGDLKSNVFFVWGGLCVLPCTGNQGTHP